VKLLLTSGGISNATIENALVELLGKPIAESSALCIPTASYGTRDAAGMAYRFIAGTAPSSMCDLGWKSLGVLELTALPSMKEALWFPKVQETDALLVWGGDVLYLCYWMRRSGLADLLPSLPAEMVYVGVSSGSMVLTPDFGEPYDDWFCREPTTAPASELPAADDRALGLVEFAVFPHVDHPRSPPNSMANAERWAAGRTVPTYAIDDDTAIKVVDGAVDVATEGHWKLFTPPAGAASS
jgi:dipeptidase E